MVMTDADLFIEGLSKQAGDVLSRYFQLYVIMASADSNSLVRHA